MSIPLHQQLDWNDSPPSQEMPMNPAGMPFPMNPNCFMNYSFPIGIPSPFYQPPFYPMPMLPYPSPSYSINNDVSPPSVSDSPFDLKRRRVLFTSIQKRKLKERFDQNQSIRQPERNRFAESIGLTGEQVKVWFQNRRYKIRKTKPVIPLFVSGENSVNGGIDEHFPLDQQHSEGQLDMNQTGSSDYSFNESSVTPESMGQNQSIDLNQSESVHPHLDTISAPIEFPTMSYPYYSEQLPYLQYQDFDIQQKEMIGDQMFTNFDVIQQEEENKENKETLSLTDI